MLSQHFEIAWTSGETLSPLRHTRRTRDTTLTICPQIKSACEEATSTRPNKNWSVCDHLILYLQLRWRSSWCYRHTARLGESWLSSDIDGARFFTHSTARRPASILTAIRCSLSTSAHYPYLPYFAGKLVNGKRKLNTYFLVLTH
jgi:hypothetical protein